MTPREVLVSGAAELGIALTGDQVDSLFIYIREMKKWNRRINLTAIVNEQDIVIKHLLDSLSFLNGFNPRPGMLLLDMGSGAGFPGFPIKIAKPEISVTLVESVKKKCSFLRHIVRTLSLSNVEVLDARTEELSDSHPSRYDVVTARAFADMATALKAGKALVKPGGLIVLSRGPQETIAGQELTGIGIQLDRKLDFTLPHSNYNRALWVFKKVG